MPYDNFKFDSRKSKIGYTYTWVEQAFCSRGECGSQISALSLEKVQTFVHGMYCAYLKSSECVMKRSYYGMLR